MRIVPQFVSSTATYVRLRLSACASSAGGRGSPRAPGPRRPRSRRARERGGIVVVVVVAVVAAGGVAVAVARRPAGRPCRTRRARAPQAGSRSGRWARRTAVEGVVKLPVVPITAARRPLRPHPARPRRLRLGRRRADAGAVAAVAALRAAGKNVAFVTNDTQLATEEYVRKLWRLGFQASLEEVVTVGGALQFVLAQRFHGRAAVVIGSPALHRHVEAAGLRIVNGTAFASRADVVVVAFHPELRLRRAARRDAGRAARRVPDRLQPRRDVPEARRPVAGVGRDHRRGRDGLRAHRRDGRQARADARADGAGPARAGPGADGRRPRRRGPRRGARRGHRRRGRADRRVGPRDAPRRRRDPRPVAIAERLETLVLGPDDPAARRSPSPAPRGRCRAAAGAAGRACPASCSCASSRGRWRGWRGACATAAR